MDTFNLLFTLVWVVLGALQIVLTIARVLLSARQSRMTLPLATFRPVERLWHGSEE